MAKAKRMKETEHKSLKYFFITVLILAVLGAAGFFTYKYLIKENKLDFLSNIFNKTEVTSSNEKRTAFTVLSSFTD